MTARTNPFLIAILLAGLFSTSCAKEVQQSEEESVMKIQVTSTAFAQNQPIPQKYTGQGDDISPPLQWTGAPPNTKSFALICDDVDAPMGTFTHWVMYNVPSTETVLSENVPKTEMLDDGGKQGKNSFGNIGYNGPMPPPGKPHRYFFKLYALDTTLDLDSGVEKEDLLSAMKDHILAEGELMGTYQRQ
jgi:Raf kinase inhibitor-like YbhB/YbcL family protein